MVEIKSNSWWFLTPSRYIWPRFSRPNPISPRSASESLGTTFPALALCPVRPWYGFGGAMPRYIWSALETLFRGPPSEVLLKPRIEVRFGRQGLFLAGISYVKGTILIVQHFGTAQWRPINAQKGLISCSMVYAHPSLPQETVWPRFRVSVIYVSRYS